MVTLRPPWSVMLSYEYELRKEAIKRSFRKGRALRDCLEEVCEDAQLKEQYFTSPIALQGNVGRSEETAFGGNRQPSSQTIRVPHTKGAKEVERKETKASRSRDRLERAAQNIPWYHLQMTTNRFASLTMHRVARRLQSSSCLSCAWMWQGTSDVAALPRDDAERWRRSSAGQ